MGWTFHWRDLFSYGIMPVSIFLREETDCRYAYDTYVFDFLMNFENTTLLFAILGLVIPFFSDDAITLNLTLALFLDAYFVNPLLRHVVGQLGPQGDTCYYGLQMPYYATEQLGLFITFMALIAVRTRRVPAPGMTLWVSFVTSLFFIAGPVRRGASAAQAVVGLLVGTAVAIVYLLPAMYISYHAKHSRAADVLHKWFGWRNDFGVEAWVDLTGARYPTPAHALG